MTTGQIAGIGVGVIAIGAVIFLVLHNKDAAALAARQPVAPAVKVSPLGDANDLGGALARLGGRILQMGAAYYTGGATEYSGQLDRLAGTAV